MYSVLLSGEAVFPGGLFSSFVWKFRHRFTWGAKREVVFGAFAGATGVIFSGIIMALALVTTGQEFWATASYALLVHIPVMILEAIIVGSCVGFLMRVKPDVLSGYKPSLRVHVESAEAVSLS